MKITVLIEDKGEPPLVAEHGLSLLVESGGKTFLVDSGSDGGVAFANFCALGFEQHLIEAIVISHNHYDHIGGIQPFLNAFTESKAYISSERAELYSVRGANLPKLISRNGLIDANEGRFCFVRDCEPLFDNVFVCRVKHPVAEFKCCDDGLKRMEGGELVADEFNHEVYVAILEDGECKLISPCSHNGIVNVIADAESRFAPDKVSVFVGGLHMAGADDDSMNCTTEYLEATADRLNASDLRILYTCHCTGACAYGVLKRKLHARTEYLKTGDIVTV